MGFSEFIGIDVGKSKIDVHLYIQGEHARFDNGPDGFGSMLSWVETHCGPAQGALFALEHTGLYSLRLCLFLELHGCPFTMIPGLEIKRSGGMRRGKSDKCDSKAIATYAYEKRERVRLYQMPSSVQRQLKRLLSYREGLVKERAAFATRLREYEDVLGQQDTGALLFESHRTVIDCLTKEIGKVERELLGLLEKEEGLRSQFDLINTIKGVGPQTALAMIVLTNGFSEFSTWRKFASYAGIAPFPNESGNFKGRRRVSNLANKRIKSLLSCCASSAIRNNPEMRIYYQRRIAEGKNKMSTVNIIRNKLLSRIFAVVKRGTPYVETFQFAC